MLRPSPGPGLHLRTALLLAGVLAFPACMSPEEAFEDADRQVYALVQERRAQFVGESNPFSISPPATSLRQRLLEGDTTAYPAIASLDLQACLEIASENSRNFQSQRESLYLAALDLTLERWRFGWQPSATAGASASGGGLDGGSGGVDGGASLSRLFGNGGRLVLDIGASLFRAIGSDDGWDALSSLGISWTQPLLRGSAREIVLEPLTQAERSLVYEVREFERFRRQFGLTVAQRFYQLVLTRQNVLNERKNYEDLDQLSARNQAFKEAGKLSEIQASQAAQEVLRSENRLIELEARFQTQLDDFKLFLGLPIETPIGLDVDGLASLQVEQTAAMLEGWQETDLIGLALLGRLDLLNQSERVYDAERRVNIAADNLRAGLGFSGSLNGTSSEGQPLSYSDDRLPWSVALDLDLPIDQLPERNDYRRSLISLETTRRSLAELRDSIRADLRARLRDTQLREQTYELQLQTVALNERRVKSANMYLEAGRSETRDVLDAQRDLLSALNAADAALVDSTLARLELFLDLEILMVDEGGLQPDFDLLRRGPAAVQAAPTQSNGE